MNGDRETANKTVKINEIEWIIEELSEGFKGSGEIDHIAIAKAIIILIKEKYRLISEKEQSDMQVKSKTLKAEQ